MDILSFGASEFFGLMVFMPFMVYFPVMLYEGIGWTFREPFYWH